MIEVWKDIDGYPNYQVSNMGRVKSLNYKLTGKEKIMNICNGGSGYLKICLSKDGKRKQYFIHRLVAQAFIPNPNNLPQVNHRDEDKQNNSVENLEWCDAKYNMNYGTCIKRISESKYKPICQFSKDGTLIKIWDGAKQAADELNIDCQHISDCCRCKRETAYGYKWCYHYKGLWLKKHIPLKDRKVA